MMKSFDFSKYIFLTVAIERPNYELHKLISKNGYIWVAVISDFGECLYIHFKINNAVEIMEKRHSKTIPTYKSGDYGGIYHTLFLLHPSWESSLEHWKLQADELTLLKRIMMSKLYCNNYYY